ncbi:hypothetical protein WISP_63677 [Willisornis vidua]|uniref:Uncharacterized protein n=1 Tax=Willisornis vidua TaxID=1566151 RepID=A0ABQ9DFF1_9PASS|nr:hypothetical protein WISP_63677 [Willisornis vidua]
MKLISGLEYLPYKDRLRKLVLLSLQKKRLHGDFVAAFQYLRRGYREAREGLFVRNCSDRTGSNGHKLKEKKFRLRIREKLGRMVRYRNRLPREVSDASALGSVQG